MRKVLDLVLSEHIRFDRIFVYRNRFFLFELDGTVFYFLKKVKQKLCLLFDTLDWFGFGSDQRTETTVLHERLSKLVIVAPFSLRLCGLASADRAEQLVVLTRNDEYSLGLKFVNLILGRFVCPYFGDEPRQVNVVGDDAERAVQDLECAPRLCELIRVNQCNLMVNFALFI